MRNQAVVEPAPSLSLEIPMHQYQCRRQTEGIAFNGTNGIIHGQHHQDGVPNSSKKPLQQATPKERNW